MSFGCYYGDYIIIMWKYTYCLVWHILCECDDMLMKGSLPRSFRHLAVPLPVGDCVFSLSWLLPTYFLFAVSYDILQTLADVAHYLPVYSHSQEAHNSSLSGSLMAANLSVLLWSSSSQIRDRREGADIAKKIRSLASAFVFSHTYQAPDTIWTF